jgi:hypothetical protein
MRRGLDLPVTSKWVTDAFEIMTLEGLIAPEVPPRECLQRANRQKKTPFLETNWAHQFRRLEDGLGDPDNDYGRDGVRFRNRFRIPFSLFYELYSTTRDEEWFGEEKKSKAIPPLYMKMMGTFRLMGRNLVYDDINEISGISERTMATFYRKYTQTFACQNYDEWMRQPQLNEDVSTNEMVYRMNGYDSFAFNLSANAQDLTWHARLAGCCNSIDGFHVCWDNCPAAWNSEYFGKEGTPTIMYQLVVNHTNWINSVTPGLQHSHFFFFLFKFNEIRISR